MSYAFPDASRKHPAPDAAPAPDDPDRERLLTDEELKQLDRARSLCGLHAGALPEVLAPEIERLATDAFRRLALFLEAIAAARNGRAA